jgi:hypothetical protein
MFLDALTVVSFAPIWLYVCFGRMSLAHVLLTSAVSFLSASATIQFLSMMELSITTQTIQLVIVGFNVLSALVVGILLHDKKNNLEASPIAFLFPILFAITGILIGRLLAPNQPPESITSLRFLTDAEDNAKWLNISSQISTGASITVGNIGGVLTSFLVVVASLVGLLHRAFSYSSMDIQLSVDTVGVAELLVIPLSTFSLVNIWLSSKHIKNPVNQIFQFAPVAFLFQAFIGNTRGIGHLSLAVVIIFLTFGIMGSLQAGNSFLEMMSYYFVIQMALSVWLPTQVALPIFSAFAIIDCNSRWRDAVSRKLRVCTTAVLMIPVLLSIDTFRYVTNTSGYISTLFAATGGTLQASATLQYISILSASICLLFMNKTPRSLLMIWPLAFLMIYYAAIQTNDIFRTGQLNYGSLKFSYLFFVVLLFTTLPRTFEALTSLSIWSKSSSGFAGIILTIITVIPFHTDGVLLSFWKPYQVREWPTHFEKLDTSWHPYGSGYSRDKQSIEEMPIACVITSPGQSPEIDSNTYRCTRFLVAGAGLEIEAGKLVEWQLGQEWTNAFVQLSALDPIILNRNIILISKEDSTTSTSSIQEFLTRNQPLSLAN